MLMEDVQIELFRPPDMMVMGGGGGADALGRLGGRHRGEAGGNGHEGGGRR
jgi:hypothetical protein